jgi:peptidoglycan hydrolase CwlO-like protein
MKKQFFLSIVLWGLSFSAFAQKNIFTVPLADLVEKGK